MNKEDLNRSSKLTVQILCIGTDRSQQTVQTKIRLILFAIPSASFGCIYAMLHQTFLFLGQLWQLFVVSQILEFLRYRIHFLTNSAATYNVHNMTDSKLCTLYVGFKVFTYGVWVHMYVVVVVVLRPR